MHFSNTRVKITLISQNNKTNNNKNLTKTKPGKDQIMTDENKVQCS